MNQHSCSADEAKKKLIEGNKKYVAERKATVEASEELLLKFAKEGQSPYAIIVTCSDSRVIPESIFSAGLGDLFVIRVAGNVIDSHQLGSVEYAADHLGTRLVVVLGHTCCGAVDAAIHHAPDGYVKYITDEISKAIGSEKDPFNASCLNAKRSCEIIEKSDLMKDPERSKGIKILPAIYKIESGEVEFL